MNLLTIRNGNIPYVGQNEGKRLLVILCNFSLQESLLFLLFRLLFNSSGNGKWLPDFSFMANTWQK